VENLLPTGDKVRIPVEAGKIRTRLKPAEIVCVQADSHYTRVFSRDEEYFCNLSISETEKLLSPFGFCRIHRSHLVNTAGIRSFSRLKDAGEVSVTAAGVDKQIPVSRGKLELLNALLADTGGLAALGGAG
jgi:DNA-binding LytR/AlgR family response regulator